MSLEVWLVLACGLGLCGWVVAYFATRTANVQMDDNEELRREASNVANLLAARATENERQALELRTASVEIERLRKTLENAHSNYADLEAASDRADLVNRQTVRLLRDVQERIGSLLTAVERPDNIPF